MFHMLRESIVYVIQVKGKKKDKYERNKEVMEDPVLVNSLPANRSGDPKVLV